MGPAPFRAYYINLDESTGRRQRLERRFRKFKIPRRRVPAIGRDAFARLDVTWRGACSHNAAAVFMCTASHLKAMLAAYLDGLDVAMIMEDDMVFLRAPTAALLADAPPRWEILQLNMLGPMADTLYRFPQKLWVPFRAGIFNTGCYLIRRGAMERLLRRFAPGAIEARSIVALDFGAARGLGNECAADWLIYRLARTFTACDLWMHEEAGDSTLNADHLDMHRATAGLVQRLHSERGFLKSYP